MCLCVCKLLYRQRFLRNYCKNSCPSIRAKVFKFCIHLESGQVYCGKENQDAEINFCLLFSIFPSLTPMENCVKDFSGTTAPRILKFGKNIVDITCCIV